MWFPKVCSRKTAPTLSRVRKFGKLPARRGAVSLKFGAIFNADALPTPPTHFGHYNVPVAWGALGNDRYSDCVFAGAAHETMVWANEAGMSVSFTDQCVLADYSRVTGFDPLKPASDQGTDMQEAASFRRKTGIVDANGMRHCIDGYLALRPGDVDQLMTAVWLTGAAGVGLRFPNTADDQFGARVPWTPKKGGTIIGGHYVPCIGRNSNGDLLVVTWGRLHAMSPEFYTLYCDEAIAYISYEALRASDKLTPEGFDAVQLQQKIAALAA